MKKYTFLTVQILCFISFLSFQKGMADWITIDESGRTETEERIASGTLEDGNFTYYAKATVGYRFGLCYSECKYVGDDTKNPQNVTAYIDIEHWLLVKQWQGQDPPAENWILHGISNHDVTSYAESSTLWGNTSKSEVGIISSITKIDQENLNILEAKTTLDIDNDATGSLTLSFPAPGVTYNYPSTWGERHIGSTHDQVVQKYIDTGGNHYKFMGFSNVYAQTDLDVDFTGWFSEYPCFGVAIMDVKYSDL